MPSLPPEILDKIALCCIPRWDLVLLLSTTHAKRRTLRHLSVPSYVWDRAIRNGQLDRIAFYLTNNVQGPKHILVLAARYGHLALVQNLHRMGFSTTKAMDWAAAYNHLEVLQWLH